MLNPNFQFLTSYRSRQFGLNKTHKVKAQFCTKNLTKLSIQLASPWEMISPIAKFKPALCSNIWKCMFFLVNMLPWHKAHQIWIMYLQHILIQKIYCFPILNWAAILGQCSTSWHFKWVPFYFRNMTPKHHPCQFWCLYPHLNGYVNYLGATSPLRP